MRRVITPRTEMEAHGIEQGHRSTPTRRNGGQPIPGQVGRWSVSWVVPLLLGAGTFLLFAQVANHQFLLYDDNVYVTQNPHVLAGLTWEGVVWAFTSPDAWYGYPLDWLSHMLDVQLFGARAGAHLLVNAGLHAANAVGWYLVLSRMTKMPLRSAVVAALFALHPLHVEAVAWVSERKELLSTLFGILALAAYARYADRPRPLRYLLVAAAFGTSLLAKPMWVTFPFLLLLLDRWPLRREEPLSRLLAEKVPLLALAAGASWIAFEAQRHGGALRDAGELPIGARLAYVPVSYVLYLWKTLWPARLSPFYPHPGVHLQAPLVAAAAVLVAAMTVVAAASARRRPWVAVGWFWFLGTLVPALGILQAGAHGIADRYTYLPLVGLFLAAVWGLADLAERLGIRPVALAVAAGALAACAAMTWRQTAYWADHVTLFTHALDVTEQNGLAHHVLSQGLAEEGRWNEAVAHAREAARLEPGLAQVHKNLGYMLYRTGSVDEAIHEFRAAIAIQPGYAEAHGNLAFAYARMGDREAAMREFALERELRSQPR